MKNLTIRLLALMLVLAMGVSTLFACDNQDGTDNGNENQNDNGGNEDDELSKIPMGSKVGQRAITKELDLVSGDGTVNISQFKGKAVVLNFWGTWCDPCKSELPAFDRLATEYSDRLAVVAVHSAFNASAAAAAPGYISENFPDSKICFAYDKPYDNYSDEYYTLLQGGDSYPVTIIIDERGVITERRVGSMSYETLKGYVDAALAD